MCHNVPVDEDHSEEVVHHIRSGRLKHHRVQSKIVDDLRDGVGPPRLDILGDSFRLDNDVIRAGIEAAASPHDDPPNVTGALGCKLRSLRVAARPELDPQLGLC
jgi:hypothetical protein